MSKLGPGVRPHFDRIDAKSSKYPLDDLLAIVPAERSKPYDMYEVIARIVDDSEIDEYKADFGKTIITAYARVDGWAVGIVANQRSVVKNAKGEMQVGGVIYSDSADKVARFVMNCNQKHIPLVFLQDVTGFMVGSRSEHGGILRDGAKMVAAVANAWPTSQIAVMGGAQASKTLLSIKLASMKKSGRVEGGVPATLSKEEQQKMLDEIQSIYDDHTSPLYAASQLWTDGIIDPRDTRRILSEGIEMASHVAEIPRYNVGVIQV
jgi:acetyl-CoA carboxylase carboxyltransferase component